MCYNIYVEKCRNMYKEVGMNQILVTKKLYVTPELKRKKKAYKAYFVLSIFLIVILTSVYVYSEYDRNKSEEASADLLQEMTKTASANEKDKTIADDEILTIILNGTQEDYDEMQELQTTVSDLNEQAKVEKNNENYSYKTVASISIPKIDVNYAVLQGETGTLDEIESLLKISPVKFHGGEPNEVGNFCIVGHNYRNNKFFSKVPTLVNGDRIQLTDLSNRTLTYEVYDVHTVNPSDVHDTTQKTNGKKEVTLITCTNDSKLRVIVRCREVK